jgi:hypothetical protein
MTLDRLRPMLCGLRGVGLECPSSLSLLGVLAVVEEGRAARCLRGLRSPVLG